MTSRKDSPTRPLAFNVTPRAHVRPPTTNIVQPKVLAAARGPQPPTPPPVYRPQPLPRVLQPKTAAGVPAPLAPQAKRPPAAPPVYRPEPKKIVQPKMASPRTPHPSAPPVYRPQPTPRVLQLKPSAARQTPASPLHQRPTATPARRAAGSGPVQLKPALPAPKAEAPRPTPRQGVIQRVLKITNDGLKFKRATTLKNWRGYGDLWDRIYETNYNTGAIMEVFYGWARSDDTYKYKSWTEAIADAKLEIRGSVKRKRRHSPERTSPPRDDNEKELRRRVGSWVDSYYEKHKDKGELKSIPTETQLHGYIGEISHQITLEKKEIEFVDANELAMNCPGIDTIIDSDLIFGQSKMHLCSDDVKTYTGHIGRCDEYAQKITKRLVSDTPTGEKVRGGFKKFARSTKNEDVKKIYIEARDNVGSGVDELYDAKGGGLVNLISDSMVFPIPKDMYPKLSTDEKPYFTKLKFDNRSLRKVKAQFPYRPVQERGPRKTSDEKDKDWNPNSGW